MKRTSANFSVERVAVGEASLRAQLPCARRHRLPLRWLKYAITSCILLAFTTGFLSARAADDEFYRRFVTLINTNERPDFLTFRYSLADTNNTAPKVTNAVLRLEDLLRSGEIARLRLGMSMGEVVGAWGKPKAVYPTCVHGLPTLFFEDVTLAFEGNSLETIKIHPHVSLAGLSANFGPNDVVRLLGQPANRRASEKSTSLVYLGQKANLRLDFHSDELTGIWLERSVKRAEPWK